MIKLRYFLIILMVCAVALAHAQTPVAYYPFNGNANDAIGSNNGTVNGATLTTDRFGNANSAYSFDGVDDFITVPSGAFLAYTISVWVKFDSSPSDRGVVTFSNGSSAASPFGAWSHQIRTNSTGNFRHYSVVPGAVNLDGSTVASQNEWYHVAISADATGQMKLYVNGVPDATPVNTAGLWTGGTHFHFGNGSGFGANLLNGAIDEVKIFNTQLSDAEVLADFNDTTTPPSSSPIAYYPFNGNANDAAGSNNGTVNGATLTTDRFGNPNSAYSFDGVNDVISFNSPFTTSTDNFTITAWVKRASASSGGQIVSNGRNPGNGFPASEYDGYSYGTGGGSLAANYHAVIAPEGGCPPQGTGWDFTALVRESGVTKLYLNGVQCPNTFTNAPFTPTQNAFIGALNGNNISPFEGAIDDVKIFNVALTEAQVLAEFNSNTPAPNYSSQFGNSVLFNGISDAITFPNNSAINFGTGNFAVEFWTKSPANSRTEILFSKRDDNCGDGNLWAITKTSGNEINFELNIPNSEAVYSLLIPNAFDNTWHHFSFVRNGTQMQAYKDGMLQGVLTTPSIEDVSNSSNLQLGTGPCSPFLPGGGFFTGSLDEIRLWNTARTQAEIIAAMNSQLAGTESGLVSYWDMNRSGAGAGLTVQNKATSTGSVLDGTTFGTASTPVFSGESVLGIEAPAPIITSTGSGACSATVTDLGVPVVIGENIPENGVTNDAPTIFPIGVTVVTWTVTDNSGNTATATQTVTVTDNEVPTIKAPAALTISTRENACDVVDVALGQPTVSDNCGIASVTNNAPDTYPLGTTTVTWTITDNSGNTATATQTVTVTDNELPTITAPAAMNISTRENGCDAVDVALGQATVSDNCGVASVTNNAPDTYPLGTTTVTWTVTDNSGNTATATQTVTVTDNEVPTITAPVAFNISTREDGCDAVDVALGQPTVSDNCGVASVTNDAPETFPLGTTTVTWTVTDNNGNTATATQTVTVTDTVLPTITAPAALNISTRENGCDAVDVALGQPTVSDNCGIASVTNNAPETYPLGTTSVTWTVTDNNGNVATATQTVTVVDEQDPLLTAPADVTVQVGPDEDSATGVALGDAKTSDNCGVQSLTNNAPTTFPIGTTVVTWTATDNSGNTATAAQNVTVTREVLPTITAPAAINSDTDAGDCFATLADLGTPAVTGEDIPADGISNDAPENFPVGTTVVTWTVRDGNGNTATATQQVTVTDRELPAITAPAAVQTSTGTTSCDAVDVALGEPTVSDNCGIASVTNNAPENYPLGTTAVIWTVTDNNGNTATAIQTVTVIDEQDPLVTAPADVTVQFGPDEDSATGVALGEAQTSDNCGVQSLTNNAPTTFPIGTTVVTWTATDNSGNTATAAQNVTVTREVLPTITAPAAINADTDAGDCFATLADLGTPAVTGEDIPADGISNDAPENFPVGTTVVTWTVRDGNGNTATATQQVSVTDRELPAITAPAAVQTSTGTTSCDAVDVALGQATVSDNCGVASVTNNAPDTYPLGTTTVTWTVTDNNGNVATATQIVKVVDEQDPMVTAPADFTIQIAPEADNATGVALGDAQASDNCGIQSLTNDAPNEFPLGLTVVTWTARDNSGNTATAQQRLNVTREELPTIQAPADITVDAGEGDCFAEGLSMGSPTFTGNGASASSDAPDQFPIGVTTVTWTVTDANGNTATAVQKVTVVDNQAPQLTAPGNITVSEGEGGEAPSIDLGNAVAGDNCGIASIENDAPAVFPVGMTVVKWTATDVNGNESTALQVVTVDSVTPICTIQIKTKPEIIVVLNKNGKGRLTTEMVDDGTSSNCGTVKLTLGKCDFTCADIGERQVTFTAVDAVGTKSSVKVTVKVVDQTKPKVSVPQRPFVKIIRKGDSFVMPDLRDRVTASDNCGFLLHQCPEPGKVFKKAQNGWIEFEAKDPSGNIGKAKMRFKLLVVNCKMPNKNGREGLEGSESLITVPWNTQLSTIAADYVEFGEGSDIELAKQIKWSIRDFDPLKPGFYQMEGILPSEYLEEGDNGPAISLPVLVLNKPLQVDIFAAKDRVSHKVRTGEILTGLHTVDPADDIHSYSMDEHPDVYLEKNVLVWKGNHMPEARITVTVHSTDRAAQTISRQITLYRETDRPTDLLIYPNPAMQETNLMIQIPEGANVSISIFDAAGSLVYQEEGQQELSFTRKVDLRHFSQGMYHVIVQVDREVLQGRIIKQ
jgi:hypothetical protein